MTIDQIQKQLLEKQQELWAGMSRTELEARSMGGSETQEGFDSAENKEATFQQTTSDWSLYTQVRDALQRIKDGTYGNCAACGGRIEDRRLESVPWTAYCLQHQKQQDRAAGA